MLPRCRSDDRFAGTTADQLAPRALALLTAVLLAACGGGSSTGGGTANSPFVGTYNGLTTVTVAADSGSEIVNESVAIFVNRDGLVQLGDAQSTIYASGPLQGSTVRIDRDAAALVDPDCSGTITLVGAFEPGDAGGTTFEGAWSSSNAFCFGVAGTVSGFLTASRINSNARASRVFETYSPVLLRAFKAAAG